MSKGKSVRRWRTFGQDYIEQMPSLDELIASLTTSTYTEPVAAYLVIDDGSGLIRLKAAITTLRIVFVRARDNDDQVPAGCYPCPDYHFEGWLLKSGYDPYRAVILVRGEIIRQGSTTEVVSCKLRFNYAGSLAAFGET